MHLLDANKGHLLSHFIPIMFSSI